MSKVVNKRRSGVLAKHGDNDYALLDNVILACLFLVILVSVSMDLLGQF